MDIIHLEHGLVKYRDTFPGGPVAFFADVTQVTFVIKNAIYTLQTLLGDGVVVRQIFSDLLFLTESVFRGKDLSMLCRLAICLGHYHTVHDVVWRCRLGCNHTQEVVHSDVVSKHLAFVRSTTFLKRRWLKLKISSLPRLVIGSPLSLPPHLQLIC